MPKKEKTVQPHGYILKEGEVGYANSWLVAIIILLTLISCVLAICLVLKTNQLGKENVIPIVINRATGDAIAIDFEVIDPVGEQRAPVEVRKFTEDFLENAFTFNRFTVRSNLDKVQNLSTPEALTRIRENLNLTQRSSYVNRNIQGMVEIQNYVVQETKPNIRVQVYFQTRLYSADGQVQEQRNWVSIITIGVIRRTARNPHGLIIYEYRQNPFKQIEDETIYNNGE